MMRFNPSEWARQSLEIERVLECCAIVVMRGVPIHLRVKAVRVAGADS
jgi:hypothetical protein